MQTANAILDIYQKRGSKGLPLERVYERLFNPEFYLRGYGKIYRNFGAMTRGTTRETVDGMSVQKINAIIGLLRMERYRWTPVRRTYIEKANGKMRPLGIPTWGDKLLQEVIRMLLEPYYEQKFSKHSHGFRPNRGCHTALNEIRNSWKGTVWFIEGDIKGCFDNIDHQVLLEIIKRDIHDGRLIKLIDGLLNAGYMENWKYHDSTSGTPQGGIISPLLANIYLSELDRFVEDTLIPAYTKGKIRRPNPEYRSILRRRRNAKDRQDLDEAKRLRRELRLVMSVAPVDPDYRRLRYIRYADDFLLGFVGPRDEANDIRQRIGEFLGQQLKLTLSAEKTLITHAVDGEARFLGYEIKVARQESLIADDGRRATNGCIQFRMPHKVVTKYRSLFSNKGKVTHRTELKNDSDYSIIQKYQSVLRGLYNYYCMAVNVSKRMGYIENILRTSLLKTLACKFKSKVSRMVRKYQVVTPEGKRLRVVVRRPNKEPLTADYGGFPLVRIPEGQGVGHFDFELAWRTGTNKRSEVVLRLLAGKCELCEAGGPLQVHHIRALADIDRPGRRPKADWEKIMSARKRKTLVVCRECHGRIHAGLHDGPKLRG
jgi:group II intron reverse transcriptase/maturase